MAGGSEVAGERRRRAAFGPKITPSGEAKLPPGPISGQKSSLRTVTSVDLERGAAVAGGSEIAGERRRRALAAFGPKIPPSGEANLKLPPISGQKSSLRTVT